MSEFAAGPAGRIERVRALMVERGYDAIVVRDEANLRWLTGVKGVFDYTFEFPHAAFITADQCLFHTDSRYLNSFEENTPAGSPWVYDMDEGTIPGWVAGKIAANKCRVCAVEDDMQINFYQGIQRGLEDRSVACMLPLMHDDIRTMRAIKDAEEIESMIAAQRIAEKALSDIFNEIKPGVTEKEIAARLQYLMLHYGAENMSFDPIVVSGPNGSLPHGVPSEKAIQSGEFVTMDFGCIKNGYCSDMTRTVAVGSVTEEMKTVYETVLKAQLAGIAKAKAGVTGRDIEAAGYGKYFGHSFGHSLGVEIHEAPNAAPMNDQPMPRGAVISAEPGIYLPGKFGIRLEDFGLVTEDGYEPFTESPHELTVIPC